MQTVTRFEANLLRLLYFFLRREPPERALPLLEVRLSPPPCLAAGAVQLVKDALAKGTAFLIAQRGGWRREAFLRNERKVEGRLWERTPPAELGLRFSEHSLDFLIWITAHRPSDKDASWRPSGDKLTCGDRMLLFFAHEGLRQLPGHIGAELLRARPPFVEHGLCWLAYPEDFAAALEELQPDFAPWVEGAGACILEALQPVLASRWIAIESSKERITDPRSMLALGQAQERALSALFDAADNAGRRDLTRFVLIAARRLLTQHAHPEMWTGRLNMTGMRIADRAGVYQAAAAFLGQLDRLRTWERDARGIGRFDDGYYASQLYKEDWERYEGELLVARAQTIARQMDPMRAAGSEAPASPARAKQPRPRPS
jgi:hypothetical protein